VLATNPAMIFVKRPFAPEFDAEGISILEAALAERYVLAKSFPAFHQEMDIYVPKKAD
jgi:hypothetical protein